MVYADEVDVHLNTETIHVILDNDIVHSAPNDGSCSSPDAESLKVI